MEQIKDKDGKVIAIVKGKIDIEVLARFIMKNAKPPAKVG